MDLLALRATLGLDSNEYENGLDRAKSLASSVGGAIATGLKIGTAAIGVATSAIGVLVGKSVSSYAEYEQLEGGVKKLYGNMGLSLEDYAKSVGKTTNEVRDEYNKLDKAQNIVLENAKNAYKTSGMSMNQYMETATSFSASLINSLGGDTVKAAKQTEVAMRAISDNFNTFGGDIGSIQYAFQGFAKQNYTMLDNLKLGYGGTKEEMQRLIDDANTYAKSIGQAGDLSIKSFSDIVTAIDLIQQKQKIAGTTSREAANTIAGSAGSMKAAWENLLIGLSDPNADIGVLIDNMVSTATTSLSNMVPTIDRALSGVATLIENLAPVISERIPALLSDALPKLISAGVSLVSGLISALPSITRSLIGAVVDVSDDIAKSLIEGFTSVSAELISVGTGLFNALLNGIREGLPRMVPIATQAINDFTGWLISGLGAITDAGISLMDSLAVGLSQTIPELLPVAMNALVTFTGHLRENAGQLIDAGLNLIVSLADGLISSIPVLIETVPEIVSNIAGIINDNAPKVIETGFTIIVHLVQGLISAIPTLVENIPQIITAIFDAFMAFNWLNLGKSIINLVKDGINILKESVPTLMKNIGDKALNLFKNINWSGLGKTVISFISSAIRGAVNFVTGALRTVGQNGFNVFKNINWSGLGKTVIGFIASAARGVMHLVVNALKAIGTSALNAFRNINWAGVGKAVIRFIGNAARGAKDVVVNALKAVGTSAMNAFKNINWKSVGTNVVNGIKNGISNGAKRVADAARSLASRAFNAAKDFLGIHSPSTKGIWLGDMFTEGISVGEDRNDNPIRTVIKKVRDIVRGAESEIPSSLAIPIDVERKNLTGFKVDTTNRVEQSIDEDFRVKSADGNFVEKLMDRLDRVIEILDDYLPEMSNMDIVLSNGALVGELTPGINDELGLAEVLATRGV